MGRTRSRAERRCPGCGVSQPLDMFDHGADCYTCREKRGEVVRPKPPDRPRLMQHLRAPGARPMTEPECALVTAARAIASRQWDLSDGDTIELHQRLQSVLFAAGLRVLTGVYRESARLHGGVIIDFAFGDADALTTRVLDIARASPYEAGSWLLISHASIPIDVLNALERHAGRPIGIYPQNQD